MDVRYINIEDLKSSADVKYIIIIIIKRCIIGAIAVIIFYYNNVHYVYNILYILHTYI